MQMKNGGNNYCKLNEGIKFTSKERRDNLL